MVGTILPIVYGERKRSGWSVTLAAHLVAYVLGAAALGLALGMLAALSPSVVREAIWWILPLAALSYALHESGLMRLPMPELRRQVSGGLRFRLPGPVLGAIYGLELGAGITTYIPATAFYVVLLWIWATAHPVQGALVLAAFGLGRALPFGGMAFTTSSAIESGTLLRTISPWRPLARLIIACVLALTFAVLAWRAL